MASSPSVIDSPAGAGVLAWGAQPQISSANLQLPAGYQQEPRRRSADPAVPAWNPAMIMPVGYSSGMGPPPSSGPPPGWAPVGYGAYPVMPFNGMQTPPHGWPQMGSPGSQAIRPPQQQYIGQPYPTQAAPYPLHYNNVMPLPPRPRPPQPPPPPPSSKPGVSKEKERENMMIRARLKGLDRSVIENSAAIKGNKQQPQQPQPRVAAGPAAPKYAHQQQWNPNLPQSHFSPPHSHPVNIQPPRQPPPPPSPSQIPIMNGGYPAQMYPAPSIPFIRPPSPNHSTPPLYHSPSTLQPPSPLLGDPSKSHHRLSISSNASSGSEPSGAPLSAHSSDWHSWQPAASPTSPLLSFPIPGVPYGEDSRQRRLNAARASGRPMSVVFMSESKDDAEESTPPQDAGVPQLVLVVRSPSGRRASTPAALSLARSRELEKDAKIDTGKAETGSSPITPVEADLVVPPSVVDSFRDSNGASSTFSGNTFVADPVASNDGVDVITKAISALSVTFEARDAGTEAEMEVDPKPSSTAMSNTVTFEDEDEPVGSPPPPPRPYANLDRKSTASSSIRRRRLSDPDLYSLPRTSSTRSQNPLERLASVSSSRYDTYERFLHFGITGHRVGTPNPDSMGRPWAGMDRHHSTSSYSNRRLSDAELSRHGSVQSRYALDRVASIASSRASGLDSFDRFLHYGITGHRVGTPIYGTFESRHLRASDEENGQVPGTSRPFRGTDNRSSIASSLRRRLSDPELASLPRSVSARSRGMLDRMESITSSRMSGYDTYERFLLYGVTGFRPGTPAGDAQLASNPIPPIAQLDKISDDEESIADGPPPLAPLPFMDLERKSSVGSSLRRRLSDSDIASLSRYPSVRSQGGLERLNSVASSRFDTFDKFLNFGITGPSPQHPTEKPAVTDDDASSIIGPPPGAPKPFVYLDGDQRPGSIRRRMSDPDALTLSRHPSTRSRRENGVASPSPFDSFERFLHFSTTSPTVAADSSNLIPPSVGPSVVVLDPEVVEEAHKTLSESSEMTIDAERLAEVIVERRASGRGRRRRAVLVGPTFEKEIEEEEMEVDGEEFAMVLSRRETERVLGIGRGKYLNGKEEEIKNTMESTVDTSSSSSTAMEIDTDMETVEQEVVVVMMRPGHNTSYTSLTSSMTSLSTAASSSSPKPVLARVRSRIRRFVQPRQASISTTPSVTQSPRGRHSRAGSNASQTSMTTTAAAVKSSSKTILLPSQSRSSSPSRSSMSSLSRPTADALDASRKQHRRPSTPSSNDSGAEEVEGRMGRVGSADSRRKLGGGKRSSPSLALMAAEGETEGRKSVGLDRPSAGKGVAGAGVATGSASPATSSVRKMFGFWGH
ncbi:hypothetical protein HDU67_008403 [Dinochytrium kinnereticum]|nr:hypothetical protein HDU67_008403 [Dinochytrium kinnereticum]